MCTVGKNSFRAIRESSFFHWGASLNGKREIKLRIFECLISLNFLNSKRDTHSRQKRNTLQCICNTLWGTNEYNDEHAGKLSYLPEVSQAELSWAENKMLFSDEAGFILVKLLWLRGGRWALLVGSNSGFALFQSESVSVLPAAAVVAVAGVGVYQIPLLWAASTLLPMKIRVHGFLATGLVLVLVAGARLCFFVARNLQLAARILERATRSSHLAACNFHV